jgi:hypothetical protein
MKEEKQMYSFLNYRWFDIAYPSTGLSVPSARHCRQASILSMPNAYGSDGSHVSLSVSNWPKVQPQNTKGSNQKWAAGKICKRILAIFSQNGQTFCKCFLLFKSQNMWLNFVLSGWILRSSSLKMSARFGNLLLANKIECTSERRRSKVNSL